MNLKFRACLVLCIVATTVLSQITPGVDPIAAKVIPKPKTYTFGTQTLQLSNPCNIIYRPQVNQAGYVPDHVFQMINLYSNLTFQSTFNSTNCNFVSSNVSQKLNVPNSSNIIFDIFINDMNLTIADTIQDESYTLNLLNSTYWQLNATKYVGFVRGLETFSQLFVQDEISSAWSIPSLPISIQDSPDYPYRGLMIDTARHFLSVNTILKTIDSMQYNKLNVLHWHITDDDSFPYPLQSFPNVTQYGAFSFRKQYSLTDIQYIVRYALLRGIQVVPEIDSPGHAFSWGKSPQFSNIALQCGNFNGQLDPSQDETWQVVKGILTDLENQFYTSKYIHLGGDEVDEGCWDQSSDLKQYMKDNNIQNYADLQTFYRQAQKNLYRKINPTKPAIYWSDKDNYKIGLQPDDIVQWWGEMSNFKLISNITNRIILSSQDYAYLDVGFGDELGGDYNQMYNWKAMYAFNPQISGIKGKVIGAEVCLWSELSDDDVYLTRIWTRTSAFSERLWNLNASNGQKLKFRALASRMVFMKKRLNARGVKATPVTLEICERDLSLCFSN
ncbi:hypothetical protein ABPG74_012692 [Tetrahymena malaccensis]